LSAVKFGVFLPFYIFKPEDKAETLFTRLKSIVLQCERVGYNSVWLDDHLMYGKTPILECWTTLASLASATKKIRLGTMVTSSAFRNPGLLAKMSATIDVISGGRLELGVGAGVQKEEHEAYGYSFPKPAYRISKMEEAVEILKLMWTREKTNYNGKNYRIVDATCEPKPIQKPHPPLIIGGCGEKLSLKVTAKLADRFDFGYLSSVEEYKRKLQVLETHCRSVGRDFKEIEKSCWLDGLMLVRSENSRLSHAATEEVEMSTGKNVDDRKKKISGNGFEILESYLALGVTQVMLFFGDLPDTKSVGLFAKALKQNNLLH
jgi:F420-dependent oxidoreductase-like protein